MIDNFLLSWRTTQFLILMEYINMLYLRLNVYNNGKIDTLYKQALLSNFINLWIFGPMAYYFVIEYIKLVGTFPNIISIPGMYISQSLIYYQAHKYSHTPKNYWIHKFHHQFNKYSYVIPMTANAVSIQEYLLLYMTPIITGVCIFRPTESVIQGTTMSISIANILIHSPILRSMYFPEFLISPKKHISHHMEDITQNYSAPIFDVDYILYLCKFKTSTL